VPAVAASADSPVAGGGRLQKRDIPTEIVRLASGELDAGVQESPAGSDNSPEIALYRGALAHRFGPAPWCAFFVSWVAKAAGAPIGPRGAGIASAAGIESWARRTRRWTQRPRAGDVAVYSGHTGIVTSVRGSGMTTVEGNWSNRVSQLHRRQSEAFGFARIAVGDHASRPGGR
jgi:CHAP domain